MSADWPFAKLADICTKITDGTHHSPTTQYAASATGRYKYVTSKNVRPSGLDMGDITYVDEATHREIYSRCNPEFGDVLLTKDGANTGNVAVNPLEEEFSLLSSVALLKPKRDIVLPMFIKYYLESPMGSKALLGAMTGTAIRRIILAKVREAVVPIPSLGEQGRLVAEIEKQSTRLDAGVVALKRAQANLKRYRAAVLKAACEGRLVPTEAELARQSGRPGDFESGEALLARILEERRRGWKGKGKYKEPAGPDTTALPELPEGWAWGTLDALAELVGGITKDQKRKLSHAARSVPYLRVANVQRGYLDLNDMKEIVATEAEIEELALRQGDILFNEGGDRDKLGRGWVWNGELPECIHQNHVFRARLYGAGMSPKLVSWYANTSGQKFFFDEGKHTTNLASISMSKLRLLPIPVPPTKEQGRIVAEVERRLSVVNEVDIVLRGTLHRTERLKQSVLQRAFFGSK